MCLLCSLFDIDSCLGFLSLFLGSVSETLLHTFYMPITINEWNGSCLYGYRASEMKLRAKSVPKKTIHELLLRLYIDWVSNIVCLVSCGCIISKLLDPGDTNAVKCCLILVKGGCLVFGHFALAVHLQYSSHHFQNDINKRAGFLRFTHSKHQRQQQKNRWQAHKRTINACQMNNRIALSMNKQLTVISVWEKEDRENR